MTARAALLLLSILLAATPAAATDFRVGDPRLAEADTLWLSGEKEASLRIVTALIDSARADGDTAFLALTLLRRGSQLLYFSEAAPARDALEEARSLYEAAGGAWHVRRTLRWLQIAYYYLGRREEAASATERLLRLSREAGDQEHEGWALLSQGFLAKDGGDNEDALARFTESVAAFRAVDDADGASWAFLGQGSAFDNLGEYDRAIAAYEEVLVYARDRRALVVAPMARNNIARLEYLTGRYEAAMRRFEEAHARQSELGAARAAIIPSTNVARCLFLLGRRSEALTRLEEERAFAVENGFNDLETTIDKMIAEFLQRAGRNREAAALCRSALADEMSLSPTNRLGYRIILADALSGTGERGTAISILKETLRLAEESGSFIETIRVRARLGKVLLGRGEPEEALRHCRRVIEEARRRDLRGYEMEALHHASRAWERMERPDSALAFAERAAASWEGARAVPLDPDWRERRGEAGRLIFTHLAALLLEGGKPGGGDPAAAAFDRLQAYKARTLLERMVGPGGGKSMFEASRSEPPVALDELRRASLEEGELLLDFYLGPRKSFLFAVSKEELRAFSLPPSEEIGRKLTGYYELLSSPDLTDETILREVGGALAKTLLAGTEELLEGKSRILVAPDGPVNLLPLAEIAPDGAEPREWTFVPSATILARLRGRRGEDRDAGAVRTLAVASDPRAGDGPLAGAEEEVRRLAARYAGARKSIPAEGDTLPAEERWREYDVLHFAAHARVLDPSPWQSEILLRSEDGGGNPRAAAIAAMDLPARLVFLSSCRSASGPYVSGEGVLGLSNAFLSAGARAVIAARWAVDDGAAARFVDRFYAALAEGRTASAALHEARESLRADPETAHPFHRSAFVLIGDGNVRIDLRKRSNPLFFAVPASALLALAALLLLLPARTSRSSRRRSGTGAAE